MKAFVTTLIVLSAAGASAQQMTGRYVETRTAAVMAGACHYNGELVTRGRDAILAFRIDGGLASQVDVAGVKAVAVVTSPENLIDTKAERQSVLVVDSSATEAQANAVVAELRGRYAAALGHVTAVRRAPVTFTEKDGRIDVQAEGYASMSVQALPDRACCKMPHLVWYETLVPVTDRQVGYTANAESKVFTPWTDSGDNSAFHGIF
jgi:hypothetical protein